MDRQQIVQLHETASECYLRGQFREALAAWQSLLAIDPRDEQALEGVRLAGLLADGSEPAAPPPVPEPGELNRRLDEVDARLEAGDLSGAVVVADELATEHPFDPSVLDARDRAHRAFDAEPFLREQLTRAKAAVSEGQVAVGAEACKKILVVDPHHFEAANLLRQCERDLGGGDPLDRGLAVLDTLSVRIDGASPPVAPKAAAKAPAPAAPVDELDALEAELLESSASARPGAAAQELALRVEQLLDEAKREASADRIDEALSILSRVFILDEQNEAARVLEERLRVAQGESSRDVETWITEGIQEFEAGEHEASRAHFLKVLERYPAHVEALDYLDRIDVALEAKAGEQAAAVTPVPPPGFHGEDLLGGTSHFEATDFAAPSAPRTMAAESPTAPILLQKRESSPRPSPVAAGPVESGAGESAPAVTMGSRPASARWPLLAGGIVLVVVALIAGAAWFMPKLFHKGERPGPTVGLEAPTNTVAKTSKAASRPRPAVAPSSARTVSEAMGRAKAAMDSGDYARAVIAYNEALVLDPGVDEARSGLTQAGELYKVQKAERDQVERVKTAFAEGEYTPALKILYRIPAGRYADEVEHYKVNAWYNLALVSLRAGNCKESIGHIGEALQLRPGDIDARRTKELAQKYQSADKDRGFYDLVESIPFRKIDD